jgi:carbamoyl-phosphate synthase large subunit
MPPIHKLNCRSLLLFLKANKISFIIPTRDGELKFWSKHQKFLDQNKIGVMVSSAHAIDLCEDKLQFSEFFMDAQIPAIKTTVSLDSNFEGNPKFVVKERNGSGSKALELNLGAEDAIKFACSLNDPIFQKQIEGKEFSAETWIDRSGKPNGMVLRWRERVVNGESHESTTFENKDWADKLNHTFSKLAGLKGHVLAQVIVDSDKKLHLIEINPRFGGASPLAIAAGLQSARWSILEYEQKIDLILRIPKTEIGLSLVKKNNQVSIR